MKAETKQCMQCGESSIIEMTEDQYRRYHTGKENVQDIFPDWSSDQRELVVSGTHGECWDKMFPPEDEEE